MGGTYSGKDEENLGFMRVCYPHFGTVDDPVVTIFGSACLEGKGVGTRDRLGQTEGAELKGEVRRG